VLDAQVREHGAGALRRKAQQEPGIARLKLIPMRGKETLQSPIDEVEGTRLVRTRGIVGWNDSARNAINVACLCARKGDHRAQSRIDHSFVLVSGCSDDRGTVEGEPACAECLAGATEERSSAEAHAWTYAPTGLSS